MTQKQIDPAFLAFLLRNAGVSLEDLEHPDIPEDHRQEFLKREAARYQEDKEKQGE